MNKIGKNVGRKKIIAVLLASVLILTTQALPVYANPPGIPSDQKMAFKFNYIAKPVGTADKVNCGDGHRIFTERGATGHILWHSDLSSPPHIVDCLTESIDGDQAQVNVDAPYNTLTYYVYVRLLGKPTGTLHVCVNTVTDELGDHLCLLGDITLTKDKKFTLVSKLFDGIYEDIVWHLDTNNDFRIAEVRLYEQAA